MSLRCRGRVYQPGEVFDGDLDDAEIKDLIKSGVLESSKPEKKSASKPEGKAADEKKNDSTPQPVANNAGKAKLMEIAKEEGVELDETMTPEEMRLAINKARGVK